MTNCEGCFNLVDNFCIVGHDSVVGKIFDPQFGLLQHHTTCIFKNTQYPNLEYTKLTQLVMSRIAVAGYYIVEDKDGVDLARFFDILGKEKDYGDNSPLGQVNLILNSSSIKSASELVQISSKLAELSNKRLWNINVVHDEINSFDYILDTCRLPFFIQIEKETDFITLQAFKHYSLSHGLPGVFRGQIFSTNYMRKLKEFKDANQEKSVLQPNS